MRLKSYLGSELPVGPDVVYGVLVKNSDSTAFIGARGWNNRLNQAVDVLSIRSLDCSCITTHSVAVDTVFNESFSVHLSLESTLSGRVLDYMKGLSDELELIVVALSYRTHDQLAYAYLPNLEACQEFYKTATGKSL